MPSAKALAGKLIKAKIAKDATSETELWAMRNLLRDHFVMATAQAMLHLKGHKAPLRLITEALILSCVECYIPHKEITRAYRVLNITPPRRRKPKRH